MPTLADVVRFQLKAEGRDKLWKVIQFFSRALSWLARQQGMPELGNGLEIWWRMILDGRKLGWMGKSLNEIVTVNNLDTNLRAIEAKQATENSTNSNDSDMSPTEKQKTKKKRSPQAQAEALATQLTKFGRLCFLVRWAVENLHITAKFNVWKSGDIPRLNRIAKWTWLVALWFLMAADTVRFARARSDDEADDEAKRVARRQWIKMMVQHWGDSMPALFVTEVPQKLFGFALNDGIVGVGGGVAALIQSKALWK